MPSEFDPEKVERVCWPTGSSDYIRANHFDSLLSLYRPLKLENSVWLKRVENCEKDLRRICAENDALCTTIRLQQEEISAVLRRAESAESDMFIAEAKVESQQGRITELDKAARALAAEYKRGADSGDWGNWGAEEVEEYVELMRVLSAKTGEG